MSVSPLRELDEWVKPTYQLKEGEASDLFVQEVVVKGLQRAEQFDGMFGYFTSRSLYLLSAGLSHFLADSDRTFRLLVSPQLTPEDQQAIEDGLSQEGVENLLQHKILDAFDDQQALADELMHNTRACLKHLIASKRLEIQIVYPKNGALFHYKIWFLRNGDDDVVVSGSANATGSGLAGNHESMDVSRSWRGEEAAESCEIKRGWFDEYWEDDSTDSITIPVSRAVEEKLLFYPTKESQRDTIEAGKQLYANLLRTKQSKRKPSSSELQPNSEFRIPVELQPSADGPFKHQLEAVEAWSGAGKNGILAMATGSGKTITSLSCARRLCDESPGPVLIIVAVPSQPLILQWERQLEEFGIKANTPTLLPSKKKAKSYSNRLRRLHTATSESPMAFVITNHLLCDSRFQATVKHAVGEAKKKSGHDVPAMLIADECHNLGASGFISNPPDFFSHRLGLSATPIREYDEEGTAELEEYFGGTVFSFELSEAIGVCLVPYRYHLKFGDLDSEELEEFRSLTKSIGQKMGAGHDVNDAEVKGLFNLRRAVLEDAAIKPTLLKETFEEHLSGEDKVFVYCSAKKASQLTEAARVLNDLGIKSTEIVDSTPSRERDSRLQLFASGEVPVLLAKKVLDEGLDIPAATAAVFLASSTVEREWIQRRGRVLRKAEGKQVADLYDIFVLPPAGECSVAEVAKIVRGELKRVRSFAALAENETEVITQIDGVIGEYFPI